MAQVENKNWVEKKMGLMQPPACNFWLYFPRPLATFWCGWWERVPAVKKFFFKNY